MDKLVNTVLRKFPKDVSELIYEFARDDTKKKEFLKTYERLFYVWTSIAMLSSNDIRPSHKIVKVLSCSLPSSLCVNVFRNIADRDSEAEFKMAHFGNVDVRVFFDNCFYIKSAEPQCNIWEFRFL